VGNVVAGAVAVSATMMISTNHLRIVNPRWEPRRL